MKPNRNRTRDLGFYVLLMVIMIAVIFTMTGEPKGKTVEKYSDLVDLFQQEKVQSFRTEGSTIILNVRTGDEVKPTEEMTYDLYSFNLFYEDFHELIAQQYESGVLEEYDYDEGFVVPWWASFLPYLLIMAAAMGLWYVMMTKTGGGAGGIAKFSKARTRLGSEEKNKKTFADVAGCDEEKEELAEIVDFLKNPKAYTSMGARIPKGVLLVGPPGTGKTLLAKAVAGEAGVQFLSISGSDFVELYVGVGAGRVRDLFEQAKKVAPAIIFIDEIDAVGRQRGSGLGGGHDEREQTLNQLLVEMDGFGNNAGVIVMAATNRADILDPALLRPGRFDRQIYIGVPDIKGRVEILKVHARKKPFEDDVSFDAIARSTVGFTGADLENLLNEAALLAARQGKSKIGLKDIDNAFLKVIMGNEKKNRVITEHERKITAYHEAGHALTSRVLPTQDPVQQVSIVPRGRAGGFTLNMPKEDKYYNTKQQMEEELIVLLGGRVAEKLIMDDISTGASNDIQRASDIARKMVTKYGMSEKLGPIDFSASHDEVFLGRDFANTNHLSEQTSSLIDSEVKGLIDRAYQRCEQILRDNLDILHRLARFLLEHETMDNAQLEAIFKGETPPEASAKSLGQKEEGDRSVREVMGEPEAQQPAPETQPETPEQPEQNQ